MSEPGCPVCGGDMHPVQFGTLTMRQCRECDSLWIEPTALRQFVTTAPREFDLEQLESLRSECRQRQQQQVHAAESEDIRYHACPWCGETLRRKAFARVSFILTHCCASHGMLVAPEAFEAIKDFIRRGGELLIYDKLKSDYTAQIEELRRMLKQKQLRLPDPIFNPKGAGLVGVLVADQMLPGSE